MTTTVVQTHRFNRRNAGAGLQAIQRGFEQRFRNRLQASSSI